MEWPIHLNSHATVASSNEAGVSKNTIHYFNYKMAFYPNDVELSRIHTATKSMLIVGSV